MRKSLSRHVTFSGDKSQSLPVPMAELQRAEPSPPAPSPIKRASWAVATHVAPQTTERIAARARSETELDKIHDTRVANNSGIDLFSSWAARARRKSRDLTASFTQRPSFTRRKSKDLNNAIANASSAIADALSARATVGSAPDIASPGRTHRSKTPSPPPVVPSADDEAAAAAAAAAAAKAAAAAEAAAATAATAAAFSPLSSPTDTPDILRGSAVEAPPPAAELPRSQAESPPPTVFRSGTSELSRERLVEVVEWDALAGAAR
jgi:hypothetical protein